VVELVNGLTLIEYDLAYEPLKSMKGQVTADFIENIGMMILLN
jgi:hypothetical protein